MTVVAAQRRVHRANWRMLAQAMVACGARPEDDPAGLRQLVAQAPRKYWVLPTDDRADADLCSAAAALAAAYGRCPTIRRRTAWSEALAALGSALGDLLDASEPPAPDARRPYYLDED